MRKTVLSCDRCKGEVSRLYEIRFNPWNDPDRLSRSEDIETFTKELCLSCYKGLKAYCNPVTNRS